MASESLEFGTEPFPDDAAVTHIITKHGETGNTGERPHCCGHTHNAENHVHVTNRCGPSQGATPSHKGVVRPNIFKMSVCGELNKTFTVRKHVKNDVNICATTHYETAYDDEGEYGPGPETRSEPLFFAKCRRDHHREWVCRPISPDR